MTETPKTQYATPADVAVALQAIAGVLYPRTIEPEIAATVAVLEAAARDIRAIPSNLGLPHE